MRDETWPPMTERGPVVTPAAIAAFEAKLGAKLPDDYADFLLRRNGGQPSPSHSIFTVKLGSRVDSTSINSLNSLDDTEEQFNLEARWERARSWPPKETIPVGYDSFGGAIVLVVDGPRRGEIWFEDGADPRPEGSNPRVDWFDRRDVCRLAGSFGEFMRGLRSDTNT